MNAVAGTSRRMRKRAAEAEAKLKRLYEAIENGVVDMADPSLKDRIAELTAVRDQAQADAERATSAVERLRPAITSDSLRRFALAARRKLRNEDWNLSAGPFACARATRRGRRPERNSHHGLENRTATDTCRRCERRIGDRWRSQFYTEVARRKRFELLTPRRVW